MQKKGKERLGVIAKGVLLFLLAGGTLFVAAAAPNIVQLIPISEKVFGKGKKYQLHNYATSIQKLIVQKKIVVIATDDGFRLTLTEKGKKSLGMLAYRKKLPKVWDGKWRIVSFDVFEKNRKKRDLFRRELKEYGFMQIQKSIWVYPYSCEDYIMLLRTNLHFGKNIRYIVAESITEDTAMRKAFKLS